MLERAARVLGRLLGIWIAIGLMACWGGGSRASAQAWWESIPPGHYDVAPGGIPIPSIASSLPHQGDPAGYRRWLSERGVVYGLEYTNDLLSNVHGGTKTGTVDQGKLQGILTIDFDKLAGWRGLTFFSNFFYIHNNGRFHRDYVGGINTIAAIEAQPTIRLSEIWVEQAFAHNKASFKVGQIAADAEFFYSDASQLFLQSDWPTIAAVNLPSGGAAYPLSSPGFRLKVDPSRHVTWMFELLDGDPAGPGTGDEQLRNKYGLNFRVNDPPFMISRYSFSNNAEPKDTGLATTLKVGAWGHLGSFNDKRYANNGLLLANPLSSGVPLQHRGNSGYYLVLDQQLYRPKNGDAQSGITVYARVAASPSAQNLIDRYLDGGIVFAGMIPSRPKDQFGAGFIYARFSDSIRGFDRDQIAFGTPTPVRDSETNLELTYQAQVVPGWIIQPDLQFVRHPSGDPNKKAVVTGVRSQWQF